MQTLNPDFDVQPKLLRRLEEVRKKVRAKNCSLAPPVSPETLTRFEQNLGFTLPPDYRAFIVAIGNGGDGPPECGLLGLGEIPDDVELTATEALARASRPFPLRRAWIWEAEDNPSTEKLESVSDGVVYLGGDGCGANWVLVVRGAAHGQVWLLTDTGAQPCKPKRTFLDWYEQWLEGQESWWEDAYGPPAKACYDTAKDRRLALALAQESISTSPKRTQSILQRLSEYRDPDLSARTRLVEARLALKLRLATAPDLILSLAREWLEPAAVNGVNQKVARGELLSLLEDARLEDDPIFRAVESAPPPDNVMAEGDFF